MALWIPLTQASQDIYDRSRGSREEYACPGCDRVGTHELCCPVGVRESALVNDLQTASSAALLWADVYQDRWHPLAVHWRMVARETGYEDKRQWRDLAYQ